jgi:conjugal transfer/entry exclusion protein
MKWTRSVGTAGLALVGLAAVAGHAQAQMATFDATNLIQTTKTALSTAQQVKQGYDMVRNGAETVAMTKQNLQQVDLSSFNGVIDAANTARFTYATYEGTKNDIGYQAKSVHANVNALFPSAEKIKASPPGALPPPPAQRQSQLQSAAITAIGTQANEEQLQNNAKLSKGIAAKSKTAAGGVAQTQLVIEGILLLQTQVSDLTRMLSASERVHATTAANAATNAMLADEMTKRALADYRSRGTEAIRPSKRALP